MISVSGPTTMLSQLAPQFNWTPPFSISSSQELKPSMERINMLMFHMISELSKTWLSEKTTEEWLSTLTLESNSGLRWPMEPKKQPSMLPLSLFTLNSLPSLMAWLLDQAFRVPVFKISRSSLPLSEMSTWLFLKVFSNKDLMKEENHSINSLLSRALLFHIRSSVSSNSRTLLLSITMVTLRPVLLHTSCQFQPKNLCMKSQFMINLCSIRRS